MPCRPKLDMSKAVTLRLLTSQEMPIQLQTEVLDVQFWAKTLVGS